MEKQLTRHRIGIAALILSLAVALTGCATSSGSQSPNPEFSPGVDYPGFPPGVVGDIEDVPHAYSDSTTLYLTLGGSSSCPPAPTLVSEPNGVLEVTIESKTEGVCTADFAVATHEIVLDTIPDEVVLVFNDGDRQTLAVEQL